MQLQLDVPALEIQLRNWADYVVTVNGMQPQRDIVILALHVTVVVLAGWGAMHCVRNRGR